VFFEEVELWGVPILTDTLEDSISKTQSQRRNLKDAISKTQSQRRNLKDAISKTQSQRRNLQYNILRDDFSRDNTSTAMFSATTATSTIVSKTTISSCYPQDAISKTQSQRGKLNDDILCDNSHKHDSVKITISRCNLKDTILKR